MSQMRTDYSPAGEAACKQLAGLLAVVMKKGEAIPSDVQSHDIGLDRPAAAWFYVNTPVGGVRVTVESAGVTR